MVLGLLLLHTDLLLHFGLLYSFFWNLDVGCDSTTARRCEAFTEAGRRVYKDGGTPASTGWYRRVVEIPFSIVTEDWTQTAAYSAEFLVGEGWYVEGELHMQAAESLLKNWPGLCDLSGSLLHCCAHLLHPTAAVTVTKKSGPQLFWQEDCLTTPSVGV